MPILLIILLILSLFVTTLNTSASSNPIVNSVYISDVANGLTDNYSGGTIIPNNGTTKTIHINGVVSDNDGDGNIASVSTVFYRSGVANGTSCTTDNNDCYKVTSCDLTLNDSTSKKYNCAVALQYYTDATDGGGRYPNDNWIIYVKVLDGENNIGENNSVIKEIGSIVAVDIPLNLSYGSLSLGATTTIATNQEMIFTQKGNVVADVGVTGDTLDCTIGSIPTNHQKWSLTDVGFDDQFAQTLTDYSVDTDLNIGYRDNDTTEETKKLYWNLKAPLSGVKGFCVGQTIIVSFAH